MEARGGEKKEGIGRWVLKRGMFELGVKLGFVLKLGFGLKLGFVLKLGFGWKLGFGLKLEPAVVVVVEICRSYRNHVIHLPKLH